MCLSVIHDHKGRRILRQKKMCAIKPTKIGSEKNYTMVATQNFRATAAAQKHDITDGLLNVLEGRAFVHAGRTVGVNATRLKIPFFGEIMDK